MDEAFFRRCYEADSSNSGRQSWKDYQEWVRVFYEGKRFPPIPGWNDREREILRAVEPACRSEAARKLSAVGLALCAEWAKDNSVRKVSTADLQAWGKQLGDSAKDVAALEEALGSVARALADRGVTPSPGQLSAPR